MIVYSSYLSDVMHNLHLTDLFSNDLAALINADWPYYVRSSEEVEKAIWYLLGRHMSARSAQAIRRLLHESFNNFATIEAILHNRLITSSTLRDLGVNSLVDLGQMIINTPYYNARTLAIPFLRDETVSRLNNSQEVDYQELMDAVPRTRMIIFLTSICSRFFYASSLNYANRPTEVSRNNLALRFFDTSEENGITGLAPNSIFTTDHNLMYDLGQLLGNDLIFNGNSIWPDCTREYVINNFRANEMTLEDNNSHQDGRTSVFTRIRNFFSDVDIVEESEDKIDEAFYFCTDIHEPHSNTSAYYNAVLAAFIDSLYQDSSLNANGYRLLPPADRKSVV